MLLSTQAQLLIYQLDVPWLKGQNVHHYQTALRKSIYVYPFWYSESVPFMSCDQGQVSFSPKIFNLKK